MRSERQVEALKDVGSIPTRPTHGIIETGTSFIPFTGKSYLTMQCVKSGICMCSVSGQHICLPSREGEFKSHPNRFPDVAQLAEFPSDTRVVESSILSIRTFS